MRLIASFSCCTLLAGEKFCFVLYKSPHWCFVVLRCRVEVTSCVKSILLLLSGMALAMGAAQKSHPAGELHLNVHKGGATGGHSFVGGTLQNTGDALVAHGYLVVTLLDRKCRPINSVLESFGSIAVGETLGVRVPVDSLKRYRIASIKGFDTEGFEVLSRVDNAELLKGREAKEHEYCVKAQESVGS